MDDYEAMTPDSLIVALRRADQIIAGLRDDIALVQVVDRHAVAERLQAEYENAPKGRGSVSNFWRAAASVHSLADEVRGA